VLRRCCGSHAQSTRSRTNAALVAAQQTQARPQGRRTLVRGIFDPLDALGGQRGPEPRGWERQERAHQAKPGQLCKWEHSGHANRATVGERSYQHGFRLIRGMMPQHQVQDTCFPAGRLEHPKSRYSRPFSQGGAL